MKILFICQANVGRSQAAMELYRLYGGEAESAGTKVDTPGMILADRPGAATIVQIMHEDYGIDMMHNVRKQLDETLARPFDKLVVMAELETIPKWLLHDPRAVFWKVNDPKGQDTDTTRRIVHEIKQKIDTLV
jgi:protein-tyrosine-phosphatase